MVDAVARNSHSFANAPTSHFHEISHIFIPNVVFKVLVFSAVEPVLGINLIGSIFENTYQ